MLLRSHFCGKSFRHIGALVRVLIVLQDSLSIPTRAPAIRSEPDCRSAAAAHDAEQQTQMLRHPRHQRSGFAGVIGIWFYK